jgi:alkanesulfonate monooxygenase SsuD/methylene tetrahydromethanopterin reductase-like flavin-dependent oxidoreductase (luciferase family)
MDESLAIITGLFKGQPFEFKGRHYKVEPTDFFPPPSPLKQTIWVVALKGSRKSMSRAVSYQGLLPSVRNDDGEWRPLDPNDIGELRDYASRQGRGTDFDIVVEGTTPGDKPDEAKSEIERWKEAGATWWIESQWQIQNEANRRELFEERVRQGPPS